MKTRVRPHDVWFDRECHQKHRPHKDPADRLAWIIQLRALHRLHRQKEVTYWDHLVTRNAHTPKRLWSSISGLLDRSSRSSEAPPVSENDFLNFCSPNVKTRFKSAVQRTEQDSYDRILLLDQVSPRTRQTVWNQMFNNAIITSVLFQRGLTECYVQQCHRPQSRQKGEKSYFARPIATKLSTRMRFKNSSGVLSLSRWITSQNILFFLNTP